MHFQWSNALEHSYKIHTFGKIYARMQGCISNSVLEAWFILHLRQLWLVMLSNWLKHISDRDLNNDCLKNYKFIHKFKMSPNYVRNCAQNERFITIAAYSGLLLQSVHIAGSGWEKIQYFLCENSEP